MSDTATLSSKFQISVPKAVREKEDWHPGQKFAFVPGDGGYLLVPVPSVTELRGLAKGADRADIRDRRDRT
ncbi:AbrB/MazE/SpoVT family DNA-binding domain-containing protein [Rhizobium sp. C4]|uniref:AbrB/MazE/SpoVT family DNA-binding domain-containing protein n=1 Tax=Rhizobium sp. C4 TaxID=1349800 RepID=UPI001E5757D1|nr:AbrB/MazE/SpoVT family DNA-binding domain-containing protein [Rhizobium sp. C4]MCD2173303.1 AbrB/MazE/SpoVT family DNA-binding domain-containing protein [Rhizobium sp. C4]